MNKILIVEDEPNMRLGLQDNLEFEGYEVDFAEEGDTGLKKIMQNEYSLVLLDVMLPNLSGFDVCRTARAKGIKTPIILLTAKGDEIDKVLGLELGADDYVTKPFSLRELMARIKAVIRRGDEKTGEKPKAVKIGKLDIDFTAYTAFTKNKPVPLSHKEFELLNYLYEERNKVVSRDDLLNKVWGYNESPTTRTVDNFILRLRQKVEKDPNHPQIILTVHGIGYKMVI